VHLMIRRLLVTMMAVAFGFTCAHHPGRMSAVRTLMASQGYQAALREFDKMDRDEGDVLYLLEWGLLLHYAGEYAKSNEVFERAEILSEDLYTKSISREAAALVTSDLVLDYVPKPHEQVLVNYFRALNYIFLGDKEGALVECRKAVDKLMVYSEEDKRPYRRDAFIEYLTGILYEWDGDENDAFISYKNAIWGYWIYGQQFGIEEPPTLACDAVRTAATLGFGDVVDMFTADVRAACRGEAQGPGLAKVVIFLEDGFVPARQEWSVNIPILKSEANEAHLHPYDFSFGVYSRVYGRAFDVDDVAYFLRVALPIYPEVAAPPRQRVLMLDSLRVEAPLAEDIFAVARKELGHDMPRIVAKTLARAIIKYAAADKIEEKYGKLWGTLANIAGAATEQADLRTWLSLPRSIYVAEVYVRPGLHYLSVGSSVRHPKGEDDPGAIEVDAEAGATHFVRIRVY
jgi:hypothetical protein